MILLPWMKEHCEPHEVLEVPGPLLCLNTNWMCYNLASGEFGSNATDFYYQNRASRTYSDRSAEIEVLDLKDKFLPLGALGNLRTLPGAGLAADRAGSRDTWPHRLGCCLPVLPASAR